MIANILITFLWIVPYVCRLLGQSTADFLTQSLVRPLLATLPMTSSSSGSSRMSWRTSAMAGH